MRPHSKKILGTAILGAALLITAMVILKDRQASLAVAWDDFYLAMSAHDRDALSSVAKTHSGSVVELWARQAQADLDLREGIAAMYTNRDEAFKSLDDAKQEYTEVVKQGSSYPELMRHSLFGLAQASEATSNLDKARDYYQKVVQQFPGTPVAAEATERLNALKDPQVDKWYNWFARQQPKPAASPLGPPPTGLPGDLGNLPDTSDLPPFTNVESPASTPAASPDQESSVPPPTSPEKAEETAKEKAGSAKEVSAPDASTEGDTKP